MADSISNSDNFIDSRDIIARIEELQECIASDLENITLPDELKEVVLSNTDYLDSLLGLIDDDSDMALYASDVKELISLLKVAEQGEGYGDWEHGETLIRDSYFEDYAQELAEDIGYVQRDVYWPVIDWKATAEALKMDYTPIDFDGVEYWIRA